MIVPASCAVRRALVSSARIVRTASRCCVALGTNSVPSAMRCGRSVAIVGGTDGRERFAHSRDPAELPPRSSNGNDQERRAGASPWVVGHAVGLRVGTSESARAPTRDARTDQQGQQHAGHERAGRGVQLLSNCVGRAVRPRLAASAVGFSSRPVRMS